jgi:hypothetical protein
MLVSGETNHPLTNKSTNKSTGRNRSLLHSNGRQPCHNYLTDNKFWTRLDICRLRSGAQDDLKFTDQNEAARLGRSRGGHPTGRPSVELHWTAGGRPLTVRRAVGVQCGRNDVARATRCDWLHGLGSRRSKPLMAEWNEPVILTVRAFNDLSDRWRCKSEQNGGQNNLRFSHGFHSLCLSESDYSLRKL